jgi:hypothetical protein
MSIPDLKAGGPVAGKLDSKYLSYKHANNTLIISVRTTPTTHKSFLSTQTFENHGWNATREGHSSDVVCVCVCARVCVCVLRST